MNRLLLLVVPALLYAASSSTEPLLTVILTNDDNPAANTATILPGNGIVNTGGFGLGAGYFANLGTAISSNAACVFVADYGSNDIAAFVGSTQHHVGNFNSPALNFSQNGLGGSIVLTPDGKFLYGGYSGSLNIGAWSVKPDCSLTFIAAYTPSIGQDEFSPLAVTPNGKGLVVSAPNFEAAELFAINTDGTLKDINNISWANLPQCASGCFPTGIDITADSKIAVFGDAAEGNPAALSASITVRGLANPQFWDLTNSAGVQNNNVPWFSKPGAAGNGFLYFGMSGFGPGVPSGEVTAKFKEFPLSITVQSSTLIKTPNNFLGAIRSHGSTLYVAVFPNIVDVFTINANGSLTALPPIPDPQGVDLLSISVFPNTR